MLWAIVWGSNFHELAQEMHEKQKRLRSIDFNQLEVIKCLRVAGKYIIVNGLIEHD